MPFNKQMIHSFIYTMNIMEYFTFLLQLIIRLFKITISSHNLKQRITNRKHVTHLSSSTSSARAWASDSYLLLYSETSPLALTSCLSRSKRASASSSNWTRTDSSSTSTWRRLASSSERLYKHTE